MSADIETGASVGRGGLGGFARLRADLQHAMGNAGDVARAQVERVISHLEDIAQQIDSLSTSDERRNVQGNKQAVAAADTVEIDAPRPGYFWIIKNIIVQTTGAQVVSVFVGTQSRVGLRKIITTNAGGIGDSGGVDIWVPSGAKVIVAVPAGLAVGDPITANLEVVQYKRDTEAPEPERV